VALAFNDEERKIILAALKARLDDVQAEMTRTDSPEFNIQLKREETVVQELIGRLDPPVSRGPAKIVRRGRRSRTGKRQR
jgi:hypothetical protein